MQNKKLFWIFGGGLILAVSYLLYLLFPYVTITHSLSQYRYAEIIFIIILVLCYSLILFNWVNRH